MSVSIPRLVCADILRETSLSTVSRLVPLIFHVHFCLNMEVEGLLLAVVDTHLGAYSGTGCEIKP